MKIHTTDHVPGLIRYLTYYVIFPDKEEWVDQIPFCQPLMDFMKNTRINPKAANEILKNGEAKWKDKNSITHLIRIEMAEKPRVWGVKKPNL